MNLWNLLYTQANELKKNTSLESYLDELFTHNTSLASLVSSILAQNLKRQIHDKLNLNELFFDLSITHPQLIDMATMDLNKLIEINPLCLNHLIGLLSFKGYHALQYYRFANVLWENDQKELAVLIQNWSSAMLSIDIHPAAKIAAPVFIDHGTGVVIGETSVVESDVAIWQGVCLGSKLTHLDDHLERHPKIRRGVILGAGCSILGNIEVGEKAIVGGNSVVIKNVAAGDIVAGVPAKIIGRNRAKI